MYYGSYHCSRSKSSHLEMFQIEEQACDSRGIIDQFEISSLPEHFEVKVEYTCSPPSLVIKKNHYFCRDILALLLVSTLTFVTSILGSDVLTGISLNTWAVSGKHLGHVIPSTSPHSMQHMSMSDGIYERDKDLQVVHERDDALLASLGYKSEFKRAFSVSACYLTK